MALTNAISNRYCLWYRLRGNLLVLLRTCVLYRWWARFQSIAITSASVLEHNDEEVSQCFVHTALLDRPYDVGKLLVLVFSHLSTHWFTWSYWCQSLFRYKYKVWENVSRVNPEFASTFLQQNNYLSHFEVSVGGDRDALNSLCCCG